MRLGIALRLIGVLLLASLVIIQGGALMNRTFEGKSEHYTVVLNDDADVKATAKSHSSKGVKVERVIEENGVKAYVAEMPASVAGQIRDDSRVSYMSMDSQKTYHNSWWDTTMITLGLSNPHLS